MQGPASRVGVKVNAAVGVNGIGVDVGGICVGKTAVGGRNGVGAEGVEQATAKEKIGRRIKKRRRKKRGVISKLYAQAGVVIKEKDTASRVLVSSYASSSTAPAPSPPPSPSPMSSGRAISPLSDFWRMTPSISPIRSGLLRR